HVIMRPLGDAEAPRHHVEDRRIGKLDAVGAKIFADVKVEPIGPEREGRTFEQRPVEAAVRIGAAFSDARLAAVEPPQHDAQAGGGAPRRGVEHVGGEARVRSQRIDLFYCWSMIFSENRYPPRIKCGAGFFGIMLMGSEWTSRWSRGSRDRGALSARP